MYVIKKVLIDSKEVEKTLFPGYCVCVYSIYMNVCMYYVCTCMYVMYMCVVQLCTYM